MWTRSTTPVNSCSLPIGISTATHRSESRSRSESIAVAKFARSRSSRLISTSRDSPSSSQRRQTRSVPTSTPITPDTVTIAPSTTRRAESTSAWKLGSPGVSIRLIQRSCHSRCTNDEPVERPRFFSSSSKSATVLPSATLPSRVVAPASYSSDSTSDVFPVPRWPITATLRIFPGSLFGMRASGVSTRHGARAGCRWFTLPRG